MERGKTIQQLKEKLRKLDELTGQIRQLIQILEEQPANGSRESEDYYAGYSAGDFVSFNEVRASSEYTGEGLKKQPRGKVVEKDGRRYLVYGAE